MTIQDLPITRFSNDPYYQKEFQKIHESHEAYKGKWNWWAFFFTGFWALSKGCYVLGLFILISSIVINMLLPMPKYPLGQHVFITFGGITVLWALIMGYRGTWFYFLTKVGKTQRLS